MLVSFLNNEFNKTMKLERYLQYNKVSTGIPGLDILLYGGLAVPYQSSEGMLIVVRGKDDMGKTILCLQLLHAIGNALAKHDGFPAIHYFTNYQNKQDVADLQMDILINWIIKEMIRKSVTGEQINGNVFTKALFNTQDIIWEDKDENIIPADLIKNDPDGMICKEALYYNGRTNSLHYRVTSSNSTQAYSDADNVIYARRYKYLEEYLENDVLHDVEDRLGFRFTPIQIHDRIKAIIEKKVKVFNYKESRKLATARTHLFAVNLINDKDEISKSEKSLLMEQLRKHSTISILLISDSDKWPIEKADLLIDLSAGTYGTSDYITNRLQISKSRFQMTALGIHQYKRRDHGIEIYPSPSIYCMQRRYLQRALVYTHSNVLTDTYQQYLDNADDGKKYGSYLSEVDSITDSYFNALSPSAYKNFSVHQVLDRVFINPIIDKTGQQGDTITKRVSIEKAFLYGHNGGVTAIIGDPNTYKRYLTYGSAFSSAYRHEHTLFLLLNTDDRIARRRLQCPARKEKCRCEMCKDCYKYLHFMNIVMGCITPEEFLFYLIQQIDTEYQDGQIRRIIIDELQTIDYCFPLLKDNVLFLPALIDECRNRGIALYVLCDKHSLQVKALRALADNVVCTKRTDKGKAMVCVEKYSGYNSKPSKIFAGEIVCVEDLFECYEKGGQDSRKTFFDFDADKIEEKKVYTMEDYWNK